jgi:hypothetical protein
VKRAVAVINRATITIGIEFDNAASILTNSDTNERRIRLPFASTKAVAITILDLASIRVTSEVSLALELARGTPAVALDSKLAAVTGIVARCMVVGEALVVDGFTRIVDNSEARVMAVGVSSRWSRDG